MSVSSLSHTKVNHAAPTPPTRAGVAPAPAPIAAADDCDGSQRGARPRVLYHAMLSALNELRSTAPAPAPDAAATAPAGDTTAPGVKGAVFEFASALFQALGSGTGEPAASDERHRNHGHGHAYAYGRRSHAWASDAYAGLAQRLEALAETLESSAGAAPPATPAAPAASTAPETLTAPPAAEASTGTTSPPAEPTPTAPAAEPTPLVSPFGGLLEALRVPLATGSDVAARLATFLHQLAQALHPALAAPAPPSAGLLLDETA